MASVEQLISSPARWFADDTKTNASAAATKAAAGANLCHYITHVTISASAAPGAAVTATIADVTGTLDKLQIPAAAFAPITINYVRPLRARPNETVTATLPALGVGVVGTITMKGFTATE